MYKAKLLLDRTRDVAHSYNVRFLFNTYTHTHASKEGNR